MKPEATTSQFSARVLRPTPSAADGAWCFIVLSPVISATLPRRGRTSIDGTINGHAFRALLEPDGQKSHWLRLDPTLLEQAGVVAGDMAQFVVAPVEAEPEPDIPQDLLDALQARPASRATWDATTTLARVDWIHWITSAKQAKTRKKRIDDACDMLASGEKRVCCFDTSGFYSKAFSAPQALD